MSKPAIVIVDANERDLQLMRSELYKRYGNDYRVVYGRSPTAVLSELETLAVAGGDAAVILADQWLPDMTGVEFFGRTVDLFPHAKRALMICWGDTSTATPILQAMSKNQIDAYAPKPVAGTAEGFHKLVTDFLHDWTGATQPRTEFVRILGERWTARCHELREILARNSIPYGYYDLDSDRGRALLAQVERSDGPFPIVVLMDGTVLADPTNEALADALNVNAPVSDQPYDVTIVGAGPAGLSAAVYGASEGLRTMVVEGKAIGGQAGTSSMIRNYLGFPRGISGEQLAARAYEQAWLFGAQYYFMRKAVSLAAREGVRVVGLSDGTAIASRAVVLAMGVEYRRLGIPSLDALIGKGVFHGAAGTEARAMEGRHVFVVGAGNSAGQAALHLARYAASVTMVVRGDDLTVSMSDYLIRQIAAQPNIGLRFGTRVVGGSGAQHLETLILENRAGVRETASAFALFVLIGATPHTAWLPSEVRRDAQGFVLTGKDVAERGAAASPPSPDRALFPFETSMPGVFAVGDNRHASVKRVASAVGEGSVAISQVHAYLEAVGA